MGILRCIDVKGCNTHYEIITNLKPVSTILVKRSKVAIGTPFEREVLPYKKAVKNSQCL